MSGPSPLLESSSDLSYLDTLEWPSTAPSGAAPSQTPPEQPEQLPSSPLLSPQKPATTGPDTASPSSTSSMETQIARQAKALVELNQQIGLVMGKTRTLGTLLDQTTERMATALQTHGQALRASIELTEGQARDDLRQARQRLRKALLLAVVMPIAVMATTCALIAGATWSWVQMQISAAHAAQQAQIQPRPSPPPSVRRSR